MDVIRKCFAATFLVAVFSVSNIANAALIERLGGLAYYDDVADLTWLADANAAGTPMDWVTANVWATGLSVGGVTGWRLPVTNPIDGTTANDANHSYIGTEDWGYNVSAPSTLYAGSTASEMAYLFFNTLGNLGTCDPALSTSSCVYQQGGGLTNTGPFSNVQSGANAYWSATEHALAPLLAWDFYMNGGNQSFADKTDNYYAWAVHSGDVSAVPVPAAVWLFGSGLIGLVSLAKRKKA